MQGVQMNFSEMHEFLTMLFCFVDMTIWIWWL